MQVRTINNKYKQLEKDFIKARKITENEVAKFKENVVEEKISELKRRLQTSLASLTHDHMACIFIVCVKRNIKTLTW